MRRRVCALRGRLRQRRPWVVIASSHGPARRLPHLLRVKKTVGLHEMVVIWYEPSSDQDEFLTELQLAHPARTRRLQ